MLETDFSRIRAATEIQYVEHYDVLPSTQDRARDLAGQNIAVPLLIIADEQSHGRGRGGHQWWTGKGSLAFSLLVDRAGWNPELGASPWWSLATAVAIVETITPLVRPRVVGLHWPNDVFVEDKKISGVLIDALGDGRRIVGIGLNVNNSLTSAPPPVCDTATSLMDLTGETFNRVELLITLLNSLRENWHRAVESASHAKRYNSLCLQIGKPLSVETGDDTVHGTCAGIAEDGSLLLDTETGRRAIHSGTLRHDHPHW